MNVRVKLATSETEIRDVLRIRHQVYVDEDQYLPPQGGVIVDEFDAMPCSGNLIAVVDGKVVGGVRLTAPNPVGIPAEDSFDVRRVLPPGAWSTTVSAGMLCLAREARSNVHLLVGLLRMGVYWAASRGASHIVAPINPRVLPLVGRIGFRAVGDPYTDAKGLPSLPVVLEMASLAADFRAFNQRQDVGLWLDSFERAFFDRGEPIISEGDTGARSHEAYLVMSGRAKAVAPGGGPDQPAVVEFGPGDVFGELALLTHKPRSASVYATESTDVMVLSRAQFQRQLVDNPTLALELMQSIGNRIHQAVVSNRPEVRA